MAQDGQTNTKNVGAIASLYVATTPPTNTKLIWYDDSANQKVHKVYNQYLKSWVLLSPSTLIQLTYAELRNLASNTGLTYGITYLIRDKGNAVATVLGATKVMYVDSSGNILIDDLGVNIQYHVTSSKLTIDGLAPDFDEATYALNFDFMEAEFTGEDYLFGDRRVATNKMLLFKTKVKNLISKLEGNDLKFNKGFYVNISKIIEGLVDREDKTGIVSQTAFESYKEVVDQSFTNIKKFFLDKGELLGVVKDETLATNLGNYRATNDGINRVFVNGLATISFAGGAGEGAVAKSNCKINLVGSKDLAVRFSSNWNIDAIPVTISHKPKDADVSKELICHVNAFLTYNDTAAGGDYNLNFVIPDSVLTAVTGNLSWDFYFSYNYETVVTTPTK